MCSFKNLNLCARQLIRLAEFEPYSVREAFYERSLMLDRSESTLIKLIRINIFIGNLFRAQEWFEELECLNKDSAFLEKYSFIRSINFLNGAYICNLLPESFDASFYFRTHNELCLGSELDGIFHYLEFGANELRDYKKPISIPIKDRAEEDIVLFTQYYRRDEQTKRELSMCLKNNFLNKFIKKIVVFCEKECTADLVDYLDCSGKIAIVPMNERLNFEQWIQYSTSNYPECIKLLANSDIYFDETIQFLYDIEYRSNLLYSCSRVDLDPQGKLVKSKVDKGSNSLYINNTTSQDCWIFKKELNKFRSDFVLGYENCDVLLKHNCMKAGCDFVNLYEKMNCIHVDSRTKKMRKRYNLKTEFLEVGDVCS